MEETPEKDESTVSTIDIFLCYSHEDEEYRQQLEKQLSLLKNKGRIRLWHDGKVNPGEAHKQVTLARLETAQIVLLLISPDFIASPDCDEVMKKALERHTRGETRVIPVIARPIHWNDGPLGELQVLPKNAKPIALWRHRDEAFFEVAKDISSVIDEIKIPQPVSSLSDQQSDNSRKNLHKAINPLVHVSNEPCMEILLTRQTATQVQVICNSQPSHSFDLSTLFSDVTEDFLHLHDYPVKYGKALYQALFPIKTLARQAIDALPERLLLVTSDDELDAIPWEYTHGGDEFLALKCHFARSLPIDQRVDPPVLDSGLHIVAVPSRPLTEMLQLLNTNGEWLRLKEIIGEMPHACTVERVRPPTIEQLRRLLANRHQRVVHFMGHVDQTEMEGVLCFEKANGDLDAVTVRQFVVQVRGTVFLVTLNTGASATLGAGGFSNLATSLIQQKVPYALGMRLSIPEEDAQAFSRSFYGDLAQGVPVEEALFQARWTLARSSRRWVIGAPVLYTSLRTPATGFTSITGTPRIEEYQTAIEIDALLRAEGAFQGRLDELKRLGSMLTGESRARIITIHGGSGQGKTSLAREAVERFAHAWPGGVWAISLEQLPGLDFFVNDLARFLGVNTQDTLERGEIERRIRARLAQYRTLIVLDNAETLVEAVETKDGHVFPLVQFLQQLPSSTVSLLVTSRILLGWSGEESCELGGLSPEAGAFLFRQSAPQRRNEIDLDIAKVLSKKLEGHPFGLYLLGKAFNNNIMPLPSFLETYEQQLIEAENKYVGEDHKHRRFYACIEISMSMLDKDLRKLLSGLWIFHAPFLEGTAVIIFDPNAQVANEHSSSIENQLYQLWQRGWLVYGNRRVGEDTIQFYYLLPTTRLYIEHRLEQAYDRDDLLARFGNTYSRLINGLTRKMETGEAIFLIAEQMREDIERAILYITDIEQGYYLMHWGSIQGKLRYPLRALELAERALKIAQGQDRALEASTLNLIGVTYKDMGYLKKALPLYERALHIFHELGNRDHEAVVLRNIASIYEEDGQFNDALALLEQALSVHRESGDHLNEARILNRLAGLQRRLGDYQEALQFHKQALSIQREMDSHSDESATLHTMATTYEEMDQYQQALQFYEQSLLITSGLSDLYESSRTLSAMAGVYSKLKQFEKALHLYWQALPMLHAVNALRSQSRALNNMAVIYEKEVGDPQGAISCYEQAAQICHEIGDDDGKATALSNMALAYEKIEQYQQGLQLYQEALSLKKQLNDYQDMISILYRMAEIHRHNQQSVEELSLWQQALPIAQLINDRQHIVIVLARMAELYGESGQSAEALQYYQQILSITQEMGDTFNEAATTQNIARYLVQLGRYQEALPVYKQAIDLAHQVAQPELECAALKRLALLLREQFKRNWDAMSAMEQAIAVLKKAALPKDATGQTMDELWGLSMGMYVSILRGEQEDLLDMENMVLVKDWVLMEDEKPIDDMLPLTKEKVLEYAKFIALANFVYTSRKAFKFHEERDVWCNKLTELQAEAIFDQTDMDEMVTLIDAVLRLLKEPGASVTSQEGLTGKYALAWQIIIHN